MDHHYGSQESRVCFEHLEGELLPLLARTLVDGHHSCLRSRHHVLHGKCTKLDVLFVWLHIVHICEVRNLLTLKLCEFIAQAIESVEPLVVLECDWVQSELVLCVKQIDLSWDACLAHINT